MNPKILNKDGKIASKKSENKLLRWFCINWKFLINITILIIGIIVGKNYLDFRINQIQTQKQDQNQHQQQNQSQSITQNITKVEKRIANLQTMVTQLYTAFENETFKANDIGDKLIFFEDMDVEYEGQTYKRSEVLFELKHIPIPNSIIIGQKKGVLAPGTHNIVYFGENNRPSNILRLRTLLTKEQFINNSMDFFDISYIADKRLTNFRKLVSCQACKVV